MSKTAYMRGLQVFISDIRGCQNKEQEQKRIDKELAKIRARFGDNEKLSGYDRRKYIWKLLYIYMLGYEIDFGHKQACDLIPLQKYSDKQVGYMACSLLLHENDEFLRLAINAIHNDLTSRNEAFQCLALSFVGNVGGVEMAEALTADVVKLLTSGSARPIIKKRAALCLLRLMRKLPQDSQSVGPDTFSVTMAALLEERDLGLLLSSVTLLWGIAQRNGIAGYETCQNRVVKILERLATARDRVPAEYLYYGIPSPWLQTKCLRLLQFYPAPDNAVERKALTELLQLVINQTSNEAAKNANPNKNNALNSVLFEAIALALHMDTDRALLTHCVSIVGKYLTVKEPNIKYLALENMSRLASIPEILEAIRHHQATVMGSLKDPDVSIRKRTMDLLFTLCETSNSEEIVGELLKYLTVADFTMREELVLKVAILAEKFAPSMQWYVDVVLQLLERAGDFVSDDIWHRVVQLVTNNESMQEYAARNVAELLKRGVAHESAVCTAAYVLGEYGRLIKAEVPPAEQYHLLYAAFPAASQPTKGLLMTALLKVFLVDPGNAALKRDVTGLFERYKKFMDAELQQRATEYLALVNNPQSATQQFILPMPKWEVRESSLLKRLQKQEGTDEDGVPTTTHETASSLAGLGTSPMLSVPAPAASTSGLGPTSSVPRPRDLLGSVNLDSSPINGTSSGAQQPPRPANAVDLLSDLFGDVVSTSGPPPAAAPVASMYSSPSPVSPALSGVFSGQPSVPAPAPAPVAPPPKPISAFQAAFQIPQQAGPSPAQPVASFADPFADSAFPQAPAPAPVPVFEPAKPTGDVELWYSSLLLKERGILYEDQYLQVGLQSKYTKGRGDIVLFWGNKHAEHSLTNIMCAAPSTPGVHIAAAPAPQQLAPKQQLQVPLSLTCTAAFLEAPLLQLTYGVAGQVLVQRQLKLPVLPHKFMAPEPLIQKEFFFEQWKAYQAPPLKAQEMVERTVPLGSDAVVAIMRALHLGVEHGYLDPSPHNEAGAAYFGWGAPGSEQSAICECRIEANPTNRTQFRVTVVSPQPMLATSVKELLVSQIQSA